MGVSAINRLMTLILLLIFLVKPKGEGIGTFFFLLSFLRETLL